MSVNAITGRVVFKENGVGIPDLLVVVFDLDPGTVPEDVAGAADGGGSRVADAARAGLGDRLGSRLTDRAGAFSFSFEDEELRIRNANEKRPDLHLVVLAPEEPGADPQSRLLYASPEIRQDAGRTEEYLIRLPADALARGGLPIPLDPAVAREEARTVVGKLTQAAAWRAELETESRKLAAGRVAVVREEARRTDEVVERRLAESLTGMTADEARELNLVPPGEKTEAVVWKSVERRIAKVNAQPGVTGYLVLTPEEAERFRENGGWRTDIPAEEIEPYLYRAEQDEGRPTLRHAQRPGRGDVPGRVEGRSAHAPRRSRPSIGAAASSSGGGLSSAEPASPR